MPKAQTKLAFEATVGAVKVVPAKEPDYRGHTGGALEVTLKIPQPQPPAKPNSRYEYTSYVDYNGKPLPRPEKKAKGESDADLESRQRKWDADKAKYEKALATYNRGLELLRDRTIAYAQLVGLAAVFGNKAVSVVITPADQDTLPGFGVALLAEPEASEEEESDEEDWDIETNLDPDEADE